MPLTDRCTSRTATALLARLDPFRILVVQYVQSRPGYDISVRSKIAINWAEDIVGQGKAPPMDSELSLQKCQRALFGGHYSPLFWKPAFEALMDDPQVQHTNGSLWLDSLRGLTADEFTKRNYDYSDRLFSALSKGVHQEFVVDLNLSYDEATVSLKLSETIQHCARIALVSHKLLTGIACLSMPDALKLFLEAEEELG